MLAAGAGDAAGFSCNACDVKASEVERCRRIDPAEYSTGMLFNPPGMKTTYKRSTCLYSLAREYRDESLCEEVRERKSLFFDGSAITRENCEQRVREVMAGDPEVVIADVKRLADVRWFRNGNGRDFDVHVRTSGSYAHRYELTVLMLDKAGAPGQVLWRNEYGRRAVDQRLQVRIPEPDMAAAAAALGLQPPYRFRVTFALVEPTLAEVEQFAAMSPGERESSVEQVFDPYALASALERIYSMISSGCHPSCGMVFTIHGTPNRSTRAP
ncbi:hypothetical protein ACW7G2_00800 [Luteimonas sp. A277]